ncbi:MAG: hypothetical protein ACKV2V_06715 [Blastocatellia bacterium]
MKTLTLTILLLLLSGADGLAQGLGPGAAMPDQSPADDQRAGSVLIWNYFTSNPANFATGDTRFSITNTNAVNGIYVHLFFVDGASCVPSDSFLYLSPAKTTVFTASYYDPGTSGMLIAVAINGISGCPAKFNYLRGAAAVRLQAGGRDYQANIAAEAVPAISENPAGCDTTAYISTLPFDGLRYGQLARVVALDNFPGPSANASTILVVNRLGGSLAEGMAAVGTLFGVAYDDQETPYSFSFTGRSCQTAGVLGDAFPNIAPPLSRVAPAGGSGWLKLYSNADIALSGVVLHAGNVQGGHNLRKLSFATSVTLTLPIIPPELTGSGRRQGPSAFETVSAASFSNQAIAPRALVVGFGLNLAARDEEAGGMPLPFTLADSVVRVRDSAGIERVSPLIYVSERQINYQIPPGSASGKAEVTVIHHGEVAAAGSMQIRAFAPAIFTRDLSGGGPANALDAFTWMPEPFAARDATGAPNIIAVFGTGLGAGENDGNLAPQVRALVDGTPVNVLYAGYLPQYAGLNQFNLQLPAGLRPGRHTLVILREGVASNTVSFSTK